MYYLCYNKNEQNMKIKIFSNSSIVLLENEVNDFLSSVSITVKDIKFTETELSFSVLIFYK